MNKKAKAIDIIAWIYIIGGIIGSFYLGELYPQTTTSHYLSYVNTEYNWTLVIAGIITSIVSGILLLGFAEIINLLQERVDQSKQIEKLLETIGNNSNYSDINKYNILEDELPSL